MTEDNFEQLMSKLDKISKKLDRLFTLNTKIAKALHLLPVTEKEERALQIQQRSNLNQAAKINSELNAMQNIDDQNTDLDSTIAALLADNSDVYSDIIDPDLYKED